MKLKQYVEQLQQILDKNPEYENLTVIYAADDEGNDFLSIGYYPSLGNYSEDGDFTQQENFDELDEEDRVVNVICIN